MEFSFDNFFALLRRIVDSKRFNLLVSAIIVFSTLLVGISVEPLIDASYKTAIPFLETLILAFFSVEILMRIGAEGKHPLNFFKDAWNSFDFFIVALLFFPFQSSFLFLLRLVRVLRTLRLFRAFPKLRIILAGMLNSLSAVFYIVLMVIVLIYVFAVIGVSVFAKVDPANFGNLPLAFFTLFQVLTLESWNNIMVPVVLAFPIWGPIYYVSFIIIGTMMLMNLFLGTIVSNLMDAVRNIEEKQERSNEEKILEKVADIEIQLEAINQKLAKK